MSFGQNVAATKIELLKYKRSSQVATMVQKILDDKRKVLLKNIEEMIEGWAFRDREYSCSPKPTST
jgi:V/A-type H+-transporting ATPase subunit D